VSAPLLARSLPASPRRGKAADERQQEHDHRPVHGPLANVAVSFGQWGTEPPLDRYPYPQPPGPPPGNLHLVIPHEAKIRVGGTVSFIIAGVHQVIVYAPGTRPEDVNTALTRPAQGGGPPLINDPVNRVYAGLDPTTIHGGPPQPRNPLQDRVEVVRFTRKGRHLVICGLFPHFVNDKMYGWVEVVGDAG
jgi:hypothetical protein